MRMTHAVVRVDLANRRKTEFSMCDIWLKMNTTTSALKLKNQFYCVFVVMWLFPYFSPFFKKIYVLTLKLEICGRLFHWFGIYKYYTIKNWLMQCKSFHCLSRHGIQAKNYTMFYQNMVSIHILVSFWSIIFIILAFYILGAFAKIIIIIIIIIKIIPLVLVG